MSAQFRVRTYHAATSAVVERVLEGDSAEALVQVLARDGLTVLAITPVEKKLFAGKAQAFDVALFCEELRTLLSSGMSLVEAVDTLCAKNAEGGKYGVLAELRQRLLEGRSFSMALEMSRFPFPPLLIASVRASERSSRIGDALDEYIGYERVGRELGRKIVSAAIYPSLVVGFGLLVVLFMIAYVVPRFAKVYEDFAQSLSVATIVLMKVGQFAGEHIVVLASSVAIVIAMIVALYRNGILKTFLLKFLVQFKTAKYYLRLYQLARIYQTMSMLLRGGYTLSDAIPLAQNLAFEDDLRRQISGAHTSIMEGRRLSTAFAENGLTDNVTERLLQVGERSGDLAKVMDIISQTSRQEFTLFIERATRLAEPILLMVVGLMIGAIIVLMYMPVFDLAGGI